MGFHELGQPADGIEAAFGVNIPAMALKESLTIGELVGYVRNPDTIPVEEEED